MGIGGTGGLAGVTSVGEIIVVGYGNNLSSFQNMNVIGTAFNFFKPVPGQVFLITSIIATLPSSSTLSIFEAPSSTSTTIDSQVIQITSSAGEANTIIPINFPFGGFLAINEGEFLNATVTAAPAQVTIVGFYRPPYSPNIFITVKGT